MRVDKYSDSRYGSYKICYQDRKGDICFSNQETDEVFVMNPRDIALSEELIQEFDAAQAFYIGVFAGLKLNNATIRRIDVSKSYHKPYLRRVK